jgi:hypothetical protein
MSFEAGTYRIRVQVAPDFVIGVQGDPSANSPIVLAPDGDVNAIWMLNTTDQYIRLASTPNLVISVQGGVVGNTVPLILDQVNDGGITQKWDWVSASPYITLATPIDGVMYCVDNRSGAQQVGNIVQVYQQLAGDPYQAWELYQLT